MRTSDIKHLRGRAALLLAAAAAFPTSAVEPIAIDQSTTPVQSSPDSLSALADGCLADLVAIGPFLLANDAGAQRPASEADQLRRNTALDVARSQARTTPDEAQCVAILQRYLGAWRRGHLFVQAITSGPAMPSHPEMMPSIELRSPTTALLSLPSFDSAAREPLLTALERHRAALATRPNWIVDVRGNGGGSDTTWAPLLPWLMPDGWIDVSQRVFVTATNLEAEERLVTEIAQTDREGADMLAQVVRRMRSVDHGQWVQQEYDKGWSYERPEQLQTHRPRRVAILIDRRCGSACEQFLLTVRQSFNVKLVGRSPTYGGLDVSNLRPHLLPSGKHRLWYAITASNRLPAQPIDGIGVAPDVLLPGSEDVNDRALDLKRTQQWLEGAGW